MRQLPRTPAGGVAGSRPCFPSRNCPEQVSHLRHHLLGKLTCNTGTAPLRSQWLPLFLPLAGNVFLASSSFSAYFLDPQPSPLGVQGATLPRVPHCHLLPQMSLPSPQGPGVSAKPRMASPRHRQGAPGRKFQKKRSSLIPSSLLPLHPPMANDKNISDFIFQSKDCNELCGPGPSCNNDQPPANLLNVS